MRHLAAAVGSAPLISRLDELQAPQRVSAVLRRGARAVQQLSAGRSFQAEERRVKSDFLVSRCVTEVLLERPSSPVEQTTRLDFSFFSSASSSSRNGWGIYTCKLWMRV
ncbi:hypothetical protein MHYP_G00349220 [Metynnis hypsauchen]